MMRRRILSALAFALASIAAPLVAFGDPTLGVPVTATVNAGPPVEINECKLLYTGGWLMGSSSGMQVEFTNDTNQVADVINFRVTSGSQGGNIRDVGTFTPGIEIRHKYHAGDGQMMFSPIFSHPHINCSVESVHFKDGTVWRADARVQAPEPTPAGPIAAAPAKLSFAAAGAANDQFFTATQTVAGDVTESDNCAAIAKVTILSKTSMSAVFRVSPLGGGMCAASLKD
ncbi:MAG: hypothetical protein ACXVAM_18910, partial [Vulcanimicrobiaceae bacterium]